MGRRRTITPDRLRAILNRDLRRASGGDDLVFRGPIRRVDSYGARASNWSVHAMSAPDDRAAEAREIVLRAQARYDIVKKDIVDADSSIP